MKHEQPAFFLAIMGYALAGVLIFYATLAPAAIASAISVLRTPAPQALPPAPEFALKVAVTATEPCISMPAALRSRQYRIGQ